MRADSVVEREKKSKIRARWSKRERRATQREREIEPSGQSTWRDGFRVRKNAIAFAIGYRVDATIKGNQGLTDLYTIQFIAMLRRHQTSGAERASARFSILLRIGHETRMKIVKRKQKRNEKCSIGTRPKRTRSQSLQSKVLVAVQEKHPESNIVPASSVCRAVVICYRAIAAAAAMVRALRSNTLAPAPHPRGPSTLIALDRKICNCI